MGQQNGDTSTKVDAYNSQGVTGFFTDVLINVDTGEKTVINNNKKNLIVDDFSVYVAALLKQQTGYGGIQYWAVGTGEGITWDSLNAAQLAAKSTVALTALYTETARVVPTVDFLDGGGLVTATPTNVLQVQATFGAAVTGSLREFGIFGGTATVTAGSGRMIDHKSHPVISLNLNATNMQLQRTLQLTL